MSRTPLQRPRGRTRTASVDLGHSAAIHSSASLSSEFHGGYALSSRLDLSSEETGVNQLVLDIVELTSSKPRAAQSMPNTYRLAS